MKDAQTRSKKMYEIITEQIQEMIKDGRLKPGERLNSVEKLAQNFNVGRSAIREALSALRAMGLIEMRQGEGTFVTAYDFTKLSTPISSAMLVDKKEMLEFLEVRKMIEAGAASSAASKRKEDNLQEMKQGLQEMKAAMGNEELGEEADVKFHLAVAKATQNNVLIHLMQQIANTMSETMRETRRIWLFAESSTFERLYQEHVAIYQAIVDQNPNLAQQIMLSHLQKVENVLLKFDKDLLQAKLELDEQGRN